MTDLDLTQRPRGQRLPQCARTVSGCAGDLGGLDEREHSAGSVVNAGQKFFPVGLGHCWAYGCASSRMGNRLMGRHLDENSRGRGYPGHGEHRYGASLSVLGRSAMPAVGWGAPVADVAAA